MLTEGDFAFGLNRHRAVALLHDSSLLIQYFRCQVTGCVPIALIQHASRTLHRGALPGNRWRGDERSPLGDVNGAGDDEPCVAVNAGAGVPATVRLKRVVYPHRNLVWPSAGPKIWCQVV